MRGFPTRYGGNIPRRPPDAVVYRGTSIDDLEPDYIEADHALSAQFPRSPVERALLCTLGPSSLNERTILGLVDAGATSLRINMSHTEIEALAPIIELVRHSTNLPIAIDTEGAQIRTGAMGRGVTLQEGGEVRLVSDPVHGDAATIPITPGFAVDLFRPGTRLSLDFDSVILRVDRMSPGEATATVLTGGEVGSRKAVTALPAPNLPALSDKDVDAIRIAQEYGVREYALSFCDDVGAVAQARAITRGRSTLIAKIESRRGVANLDDIARSADRLLIDRGDLSREVRLEAIPLLQKAIIRKANALRVPVYVATNLLESMVVRRAPTRAEVNDVLNTLLDGADGLVLASETAIGRYPVEAARMISTLMREYTGSIEGYRIQDLIGRHPLETAGGAGSD